MVFLTSSSFLPIGAVSKESFLRDRAITSGVGVFDVYDEDHVDKVLDEVSKGLVSISRRCFSVIFSKE